MTNQARSVRFAAGDTVVRQGEAAHHLYIIVQGQATITRLGVGVECVREVEVGTLGPGQFFGEIGLLAGAPRATTVRAQTDLQLLAVDRRTFHQLFERSVGTDARSSRFSGPQLAVIRALL